MRIEHWLDAVYREPDALNSVEEFARAHHDDLGDLSLDEVDAERILARLLWAVTIHHRLERSSWLEERIARLDEVTARLRKKIRVAVMSRSRLDPLAPMAGADGTAPGRLSVDAPDVQRLGDEIAFSWPAHGVTVSFDQLRESGDGIHGEVCVVSGILGEIHWAKLNVASGSAREGLVRKLDQAAPGVPWRPILERACRKAAQDLRTGEPAAPLVPCLADERARYLMPKLLLAGETNLIFADGGSGKSLLALALAVAVAGGVALPNGLRPREARAALFLDWESTRTEHEDRFARLLDGLNVSEPPAVIYRL